MATQEVFLVTGASGQLGQSVLRHLLGTHEIPARQIIATTRSPERLAQFAAQGVSVRTADFDRADAIADAFAGATRALIVSTDRVDVPGARLAQHRAAVAAALKAKIRHVVYTSMMHPDPDSPMSLAPDHYATEQALAASSLGYTILRNCWYTDFLLYSLPAVIASGQLYSSAGAPGVAYVTREDCSRACAAALVRQTTDRETLDVTGPSAVTHSALAALAGEISGKPVKVVSVTDAQLRAGLEAAGLPPPIVALTVAMDVNTRAGNVANVADTVQRLTGNAPESVREFLLEHKSSLVPHA